MYVGLKKMTVYRVPAVLLAGVPENRTSPHITAHHHTSLHINRTSPHINGNSDRGINANDDITLAFKNRTVAGMQYYSELSAVLQ